MPYAATKNIKIRGMIVRTKSLKGVKLLMLVVVAALLTGAGSAWADWNLTTTELSTWAADSLWNRMRGDGKSGVKQDYITEFRLDLPTSVTLSRTVKDVDDNDVVEEAGFTISWGTIATAHANNVIISTDDDGNTSAEIKRFLPSNPNDPQFVNLPVTLTAGSGPGAVTHSRTLYLGIPRKGNISNLLTFASGTAEYVDEDTPVRIGAGKLKTLITGEDNGYEYTYSYTTPGPSFTPAGVSETGESGSVDFSHDDSETGVVGVGEYIATLTVSSDRYWGQVSQPFTVKGIVLTASDVALQVPESGGFTYINGFVNPTVVVSRGDMDFTKDTDFTTWTKYGGVNVGTDTLFVQGKSGKNISSWSADIVKIPFTIGKATVSAGVIVADRPYDGTDTVRWGVAGYVPTFTFETEDDGYASLVNPVYNTDYKITKAVYTNGGKATGDDVTTAEITIKIDTTKTWGRNHAFENGATEITIRDEEAVISKIPLLASYLKVTYPTNPRYTGEEHPVEVAFDTTKGLTDAVAPVILYTFPKGTHPDPDLADEVVAQEEPGVAPVKAGTYTVKAVILGGENFTEDAITLSTAYKINPRALPSTPVLSPSATQNIRSGAIAEISATVKPDTFGLTYQWFQIRKTEGAWTGNTGVFDTLPVSATEAVLSVNTSTPFDTSKYYVEVTVSHPLQADTTLRSAAVQINVNAEAKNIQEMTIDPIPALTYNGRPQNPTASSVKVTDNTGTAPKPLASPRDYTFVVDTARNVNAGLGGITIYGKGEYGYSTYRTYEIAKAALTPSIVTHVSTRIYNGAAQPVTISATPLVQSGVSYQRTGLGAVSEAVYISLSDSTASATAPTNAGSYVVQVKIGEGTNFLALDSLITLGSYTIVKKTPELADFTDYAVPTAPVLIQNAPVNIGEIKLPGSGYVLAVKYVNLGTGVSSTVSPTDTGTYRVTVEVVSGTNYNPSSAFTLGTYSIVLPQASVAEKDHVIPGDNVEQAVVAPISVVAGEFTVGPNPVAKVAGKVNFFWQGKALSGGTLYVFDGSGNVVTRVAVSDRGTTTDRRAIAGWNLVDAKGRPVAEGTYLVKGALSGKDGKKVKVSSILGVSK